MWPAAASQQCGCLEALACCKELIPAAFKGKSWILVPAKHQHKQD